MMSRPRRVLWSILAAMTVLLMFDALRPPARQLTNRILIGVIDGYRASLSPLFAMAGVKCSLDSFADRGGPCADWGVVDRGHRWELSILHPDSGFAFLPRRA